MATLGPAFGKYQLVRPLATGGMAEIHLAVEHVPGAGARFVALKRILPNYADDPDFVEFFLHEARLALQLTHPNIVQSHELGRVSDVYYLAMEYVRGETLLDLVRRAATLGRHLTLDAVVKILADVAAGLDYVHRACDVDGEPLKIVHRDVSPHNIVISQDGVAKLVDFGIARATCQEFRTRTGVVKGKFSYLAPEQIQRGRAFDHRADLFALGIVAFETLTRRPLFRGMSDAETVRRLVNGRIPPVRDFRPDCPPALAAVVAKALERDPDRRYASGAALLRELEEAARASGIYPSVSGLRDEVARLMAPAEAAAAPGAQAAASPPPTSAPVRSPTPVTPPDGSRAPDLALEHFLRLAGSRRGRAHTVSRIAMGFAPVKVAPTPAPGPVPVPMAGAPDSGAVLTAVTGDSGAVLITTEAPEPPSDPELPPPDSQLALLASLMPPPSTPAPQEVPEDAAGPHVLPLPPPDSTPPPTELPPNLDELIAAAAAAPPPVLPYELGSTPPVDPDAAWLAQRRLVILWALAGVLGLVAIVLTILLLS